MSRIVRIHVALTILSGLAVALLIYGADRLALAILCLVTLGQITVAETYRVTIAPFARKEDR